MTGLQNGSDPTRAGYDFRALARAIRLKRNPDTRGIREIADEIGITFTDFSRAMGGQNISVGKVIALCHWLGVPVEHFYLAPDPSLKSPCCTGVNVKQESGVRP